MIRIEATTVTEVRKSRRGTTPDTIIEREATILTIDATITDIEWTADSQKMLASTMLTVSPADLHGMVVLSDGEEEIRIWAGSLRSALGTIESGRRVPGALEVGARVVGTAHLEERDGGWKIATIAKPALIAS